MTRVGGAWLRAAGTQRLFHAYAQAGFDLFAVGGCVRNDLLGQPVADVDMASNARPDTATEFLTAAGFRVIPTGIDHGTITVISDSTPYEITTFRKDVETDGRRAKVRFSGDMLDDAARRDFTINALYADMNGQVHDPVGGLRDISAPHIRFIGSASDRIQEDYLRTLRFFRFHAWYAAESEGFDAEALDAMAANLDGLENLSRERVGAELTKLLSAPNPTQAVMVMAQIGILNRVLPGADARFLGPVLHLEAEVVEQIDPMLRLAAIATPQVAHTLRLSKAQYRAVATYHDSAFGGASPGELGFRLGATMGSRALALRQATLEQPIADQTMRELMGGANAVFPVTAADLSKKFKGRALGERLKTLEAEWIASGFSKTKAQLLA